MFPFGNLQIFPQGKIGEAQRKYFSALQTEDSITIVVIGEKKGYTRIQASLEGFSWNTANFSRSSF